jgi:hypothetical protein
VETATEVRYAGVVVGRASPLRDKDDVGVFVLCAEPLPVGTPVTLKLDDAEHGARVSEVVESADPNLAGMRVRFVNVNEARRGEAQVEVKVARPKAAPPPADVAPPAAVAAPVAEPSAAVAAPVAEPPAAVATPVVEPPAVEPPAAVAPAVEPTVEAAPAAEPSSGTAVPSPVEGDGSAAAGSGKRRRKRR